MFDWIHLVRYGPIWLWVCMHGKSMIDMPKDSDYEGKMAVMGVRSGECFGNDNLGKIWKNARNKQENHKNPRPQ